MTTTMDTPHTTGLFAELLAGAQAVQERPTILAERDRAKAELEAANDRLNEYRTWHDDMARQINDLKAAADAKEAELAQATFRESQVRTQLEMLVDAFKTVVGDAQAAVELVTPKPEPVPVPQPEPSVPFDSLERYLGYNPGPRRYYHHLARHFQHG